MALHEARQRRATYITYIIRQGEAMLCIGHGPISLILYPLDGASYLRERDSNPRHQWTLRKVWCSWLRRHAGAD